jgi:hypothetical protein
MVVGATVKTPRQHGSLPARDAPPPGPSDRGDATGATSAPCATDEASATRAASAGATADHSQHHQRAEQ